MVCARRNEGDYDRDCDGDTKGHERLSSYMWIGIECGVEAHELEKWACEIERIGGGGGVGDKGNDGGGQTTSGERVGEFLL